MSFIILGILVEIIFFIKKVKVNRIAKNILYLYSFFTLIILYFSTLNLYKISNVSSKVYIMWIINIILVVLTVLICSKTEKIYIKESNVNEWVDRIANSKILFYIGTVMLLFLVFFKIRYNSIIKNLSFIEARMAKFTLLFSSGVEEIFFKYILVTTLIVYLILGAMLIVNKKILNRITIISLLGVALYSTIGYGRMTIFEFVFFIVFSYLIFKCKNKIRVNIKVLTIITLSSIVLILIGAVIVVIRLKGKEQLTLDNIIVYGIQEQLRQIYIYFVGGFRMFEHFLQNGFQSIEGLTITRLTFGGVEDMFGLVVNNIGFKFTTINSMIVAITQTTISIGDGVNMNAFYTCLMNYYCDLGYVGIIVYPILHGILIAYSINNYIKKNSVLSYILMLYVMYNMMVSIYRWDYQSGTTMFLTISIIILDVLWKYKKIQGGNIE